MQIDYGALVGLLATILGSWIGHRLTKPSDHERALLLERIANDAAALIVATFPNAAWAVLLDNVLATIAKSAGLPTRNADALERAAAAALTRLGKAPA